jgi:DNA invertase Pin-like site-specific DNA recombinase
MMEEFTDQGVTGCKEPRPALNRLMADAWRRQVHAVLVWKIDRFGRSLKRLINALAELAALGVASNGVTPTAALPVKDAPGSAHTSAAG